MTKTIIKVIYETATDDTTSKMHTAAAGKPYVKNLPITELTRLEVKLDNLRRLKSHIACYGVDVIMAVTCCFITIRGKGLRRSSLPELPNMSSYTSYDGRPQYCVSYCMNTDLALDTFLDTIDFEIRNTQNHIDAIKAGDHHLHI